MSKTTHSDMLNEIRDVNLLYLLFVQRQLREDRAAAMVRIGIPEALADVLAGLSLAQVARLAASNQLLCRFRFDVHAILGSLADKGASAAAALPTPAAEAG
jgi:flagellar transcriptional activator FlhD